MPAQPSSAQTSSVSSGNREPAHHEGEQQARPFSGKGVTIGGSDPNDRDEGVGRKKQNYNQVVLQLSL